MWPSFRRPLAFPPAGSTMTTQPSPPPDEVEQLLLNAQLRDDLEPYFDESVELMAGRRLPTHEENEFLASMLAWERAPVLPISRWFEPELKLPHPDSLDDAKLHEILWDTIQALYDQRIILELTEHLSDRQLYLILYRDILPSYEKKVELPTNYLHWHCLDMDLDEEQWLMYYASPGERRQWLEESDRPLPPSLSPPHPRKTPRRTTG